MPELNDSLAWLVAAGAGALLFLCMLFLTRNLNWWWLKWVLRLVPPVALLLPVAVPGQPGFYAPAFLVAPFEAFLQADGTPDAAVGRLIVVLGGLLAVITLLAIARWTRRRTAVSSVAAAGQTEGAAEPSTGQQKPLVS